MIVLKRICFLILIGATLWSCGKKDAAGPGAEAVPEESTEEETENAAPDFSTWIPYASDEGGFSVKAPTVFVKNYEKTPTDGGDIQIIRFVSQTDFHHIYLIVINQIPEALLAGRDPNEMLQGTREGAVSQFQGTIVSERQMTLQGHAGLEIVLTGRSEGMDVEVTIRFFLVKNNLFHIYVINRKGFEDPASAQYFLDSFAFK